MASSSQSRRSRREQLMAQRVAQAQKERNLRIMFVAVGVVVLALVIGVAIWGFSSQNNGGNSNNSVVNVPPNSDPDKNGIVLAPVKSGIPTLEIFSDYNCSVCRGADLTLNAVLQQAVESGTANVVFHALSLLTNTSRDAAIAATCADFQGKFFDYHNQLFLNQSGTGFDNTTLTETIPGIVGIEGDALTEFQSCVNNKDTGGFVDAEEAYAAKQNATTPPTFLLDGVNVGTQIWNANTKTYDPDNLRALLGM